MQTVARGCVLAGRVDIGRRGGLRVAEDASLLVAGRYQLLALLGAGSAGAVWLAQDELLNRRVALKRVERANPAGRAVEEARAAAAVLHPNTVRIHDLVRDEAAGVEWVVMEALYGRSLADVLREEVRLGVDETRHIARAVLAALQAIHKAGLVHRDVKPANIQLCEDGRVVLLDFGLAAAPMPVDPALVVGSLPYLAPEIFGRGRYSPASDLYALGMTLYAALSGDVPVVPTCDLDTCAWVTPEISQLPPSAGPLDAVVRGLLNPDVQQRLNGQQAGRLLDRP